MTNVKIRKLRDIFGAKFLGESTTMTSIVVDGSFVGRYQAALKRRNPEDSPVFNYKTMAEFFRECAVELDIDHYPEIDLYRAIIDTPENRIKINETADLIQAVNFHIAYFEKAIGAPSFFSHYQSEVLRSGSGRNFREFSIFITDDPAYFVMRPHLGYHCIVGPEIWRNRVGGTRFLSIEEFRTITKADHAYRANEKWIPLNISEEDQ